MAIYLQVRAGSVGLLLDALRVHEVVDLPPGFRDDQPFAEWRGQVLPTVHLARHLALPQRPCAQAAIYSPAPDAPPAMLLLEGIAGLTRLEAGHWQALPASLPARTRALFDAVHWDEAAGQQLYRLRAELEGELLGVPQA